MTPRMPWAGGTAAAEKIPRTPLRMSRVRPDCEKPAARLKMEKRRVEVRKRGLRPKWSARVPKRRRRDPDVRLGGRLT